MTVFINHLVRLLRNPSQLYLRHSLNVAVDPKFELHDGTEPITLEGLAAWRVTHELVEARRNGLQTPATIDRLRAAGELPVQALGIVANELLGRRADALLAAAAPHSRGQRLDDLWLSLTIDGIVVEGWIDSIWPSAHVHLRPSRLALAGIIDAWVQHLCMSATGLALATVMVARSSDGRSVAKRVFASMDQDKAKNHLGQLLQDYRLAMALPLPFWLKPAEVYYAAKAKRLNHRAALLRAADVLDQMRSEGNLDSHFEDIYGDNPCADDWPTLAGIPQISPFSLWTERWLDPVFQSMNASFEADSAEPSEANA